MEVLSRQEKNFKMEENLNGREWLVCVQEDASPPFHSSLCFSDNYIHTPIFSHNYECLQIFSCPALSTCSMGESFSAKEKKENNNIFYILIFHQEAI